MRYEILLAPEALEDLKRLRANTRAEVKAAIERPLRHEPTKQSKSRIKKLRGISRPGFRLRVGSIRVFYDVTTDEAQVLAIVAKENAQEWLRRSGEKP